MRATDEQNGMRRSDDVMDAGSMGEPGGMGGEMGGGMEGAAGDQMAGGPEERTAMGGMRAMTATTNGSGGMGGPTGDGAEGPPPRRRICGTMNVHHRLISTSPEYVARRASIESHALAFKRGVRAQARLGVVRIPVVTHVVWNAPNENISDAQIQTQIDVLNRDFRKRNPDISQVPAVFQGLVADMEVEFALATRDPSGNPTTGITRTQTSIASFSDDDRVKSQATGGADAWPADRYLNLWVCPLDGGGLLGYAQFPGGPAGTDGVVINYTAFGTTGTAAAPFNLGRTATHEVGHWLNLLHIWGDDGNGCSGSDQVDDTPNQGGPNHGAPTFPHVSCNNSPNGDLFMNYMDYVDDRAMVMFTKGQADRAEACLEGPRRSFAIEVVGHATASGPVVSWGSDRIDAFVIGTDSALYHKYWNGNAWGPSVTGFESLGGVCTSPAEVASWATNRLDVFVIGTNSGLYHKYWNGSAWGPSATGFESLGGVCTSPPKAVTWGPNRLDVFVIGTNSGLYHKYWNGSAWGPSATGFESLGGVCTAPPEAVSWAANRLDVFVIGTDSALYHKYWNGSAWGPSVTGFESLGGACLGPPKAVAWGPDRLDVFVIGTDSALYHKYWNGSAWGPSATGFESLGGVCSSPPAVVSWGPDRLDIFVVGTNSALYHKYWNGSAWGPSATGFESLGGACVGTPRVCSWGPNRLDVFVVGTDSALYHKWWDGNAWRPSLTGFERLGGVISELRLPAGAIAPPLAARAARSETFPMERGV